MYQVKKETNLTTTDYRDVHLGDKNNKEIQEVVNIKVTKLEGRRWLRLGRGTRRTLGRLIKLYSRPGGGYRGIHSVITEFSYMLVYLPVPEISESEKP